jgi:hypothetical protein
VLIDTASKEPVSSVTIVLARKEKGKDKCTIDSSLTGVSNARGEVHIPDVMPGEYVVFQSPSGTIHPQLKGMVVTWSGSASGYNFSFGAVSVKKGKLAITSKGDLGIINGYMEGTAVYGGGGALGINTTKEGSLLTVRAPSAGTAPVKMEINSDKPSSSKGSTASDSASTSTAPPEVPARPQNCASGLHFVPGRGCVVDVQPSPTVPDDFQDRGDTIFQRSTRLLWQKVLVHLMRWEEARSFCAGLRGGPWRLPTKEELLALHKSGLVKVRDRDVSWATSDSGTPWLAYFDGGGSIAAVSSMGNVRCVR